MPVLLEACVDTGTPAVHAGLTLFVPGERSMQRVDTPERQENTEPLEKHYLYYPEGTLDVF